MAFALGSVMLVLGLSACGGDDEPFLIGDDTPVPSEPAGEDDLIEPIEPPLPPSSSETEFALRDPPPPPPGVTVLQIDPDGEPLKSGSRGTRVEQLQRALAALGLNPGKADGVFGAKTEAAVQRFQRQNGLADDGVAGPMTLRTLNSALAASIG